MAKAKNTVEPRPSAGLLREQILQAAKADLNIRPIDQFGGGCFIKQLTVSEMAQCQTQMLALGDRPASMDAKKIVLCLSLCDDAGTRIFDTPDQLDALNGKDVSIAGNIALEYTQVLSEGVTDDEIIAAGKN